MILGCAVVILRGALGILWWLLAPKSVRRARRRTTKAAHRARAKAPKRVKKARRRTTKAAHRARAKAPKQMRKLRPAARIRLLLYR